MNFPLNDKYSLYNDVNIIFVILIKRNGFKLNLTKYLKLKCNNLCLLITMIVPAK